MLLKGRRMNATLGNEGQKKAPRRRMVRLPRAFLPYTSSAMLAMGVE
jgi:hypothetical protein